MLSAEVSVSVKVGAIIGIDSTGSDSATPLLACVGSGSGAGGGSVGW